MPAPSNPDQALILRFLQDRVPRAIDTNPMAVALGTSLRNADGEAGTIELAFDPAPLFIQGTGVLQGGAVTAMLDFAMAFALLAQLPPDRSCATATINVALLRAAPAGRYLAHGAIERRGRTLGFTQARLLRADTLDVVATATSTLAVIAPRA